MMLIDSLPRDALKTDHFRLMPIRELDDLQICSKMPYIYHFEMTVMPEKLKVFFHPFQA